jgi:hypothetical protein
MKDHLSWEPYFASPGSAPGPASTRNIRAAGFTDLQDAHFAVFPGRRPDGVRLSQLARHIRMSQQAPSARRGQDRKTQGGLVAWSVPTCRALAAQIKVARAAMR